MSVITNIEGWGNSHRPGWLDIFRVVLGIFITWKGLDFLLNIESLKATAAGINMAFTASAVAHYVIFAHVLGGPLIIVGLFTRAVCAIQLPVLLGAIVFVNYPAGFLSIGNHMELELSIITTTGLIVFMVFGAGRYSLDHKRRKEMAHT